MTSVKIRLNKSNYVPGDCIEGQAVCQFRSPKQFRKIRMRFTCKEHTQWNKSTSHYNSVTKKTEHRNVHYSGDNTIVLQEILCMGEGELPSGQHIFPFSFNIPHRAPSSFHRKYGDITYALKLTVDRAFKFDIEDDTIITVFSPVSLQQISRLLMNPIQLSDEKTVCCWCCAGGTIELQLECDRKCFTQGKPKNIKVYCLNMSNQNVEEIVLKIKQRLKFQVTSPSHDTKEMTDTIFTTKTTGVGAHGEKSCDLVVRIPNDVEVPNFDGCNLFDVEYYLKLEAVVSGCHTNLEIETDVGISNTPNPEEDQPQATDNVPEYPGMPMPMPSAPVTSMPMPAEGYGVPYPAPPYPLEPAPSAPWNAGPSAPPDIGSDQTNNELPPPTYNEAVKNA